VSLVHDYTSRKLTYGEDALNAISSLLLVMTTSRAGGFISSLPEMFFNEALLWQPVEPMQRRKSPAGTTNLPSWSWAGWEGTIMREEWLDHWSHLPRNVYSLFEEPVFPTREHNKSESDLAESSTTPFIKLQVGPVVTWFCGNTLQERLPINVSGLDHIGHFSNTDLQPPPGWSRTKNFYNIDGYVYEDLPKSKSSYPLPIPSTIPPCLITARYLFCRTQRTFLLSKRAPSEFLDLSRSWGSRNLYTGVVNRNNDFIGVVNLNLGGTNFVEPHEGMAFELVIISTASVRLAINAMNIDALPVNFDPREQQFLDVLAWGNPIGAGSCWVKGDRKVLEFYHVMWIGWEDGIAYRKGVGRVLKEAWDLEETEGIDLVLG